MHIGVRHIARDRASRTPWLALAVVAGGCSLALSPAAQDGCHADSDCSGLLGEVCRSAEDTPVAVGSQGLCVIPGANSQNRIYLQVTPISSYSSQAIQIGPISLSNGQNQQLSVPLPVNAMGTVVDSSSGTAVAANVELVSVPLIPFLPQVFRAVTTNGSFSQLLPQGSYNITVQPTNSTPGAVPPQLFPGVTVGSGGEVEPLQVTTDVNDLLYVGGSITNSGTGQYIAGVTVTVLNSGVAISQAVTTDVSGSFRVGIVPPPSTSTPAPFWVQFQLSPGPSGAPFPTLTLNKVNALSSTLAGLPLSIVLPGNGNAVPVTGHVVDSRGNPLPEMNVTFSTTSSAQTLSGSFSFSASATTANDGSFSLQLVPAEYIAVALPPVSAIASGSADGGYAGTSPATVGLCTSGGNVQVSSAGGPTGLVLACENLQTAYGLVAFDATPVPGASVDVYRRADMILPSVLHLQTTSGNDGTFSLGLPSGVYDVNIEPSEDSLLPYLWAPAAFQVGASLPAQTQELFALSQPFQLFGTLLEAGSNTPLEALIDAYAADGWTTQPIGHGHAAANGMYSIVLPSSGADGGTIDGGVTDGGQ